MKFIKNGIIYEPHNDLVIEQMKKSGYKVYEEETKEETLEKCVKTDEKTLEKCVKTEEKAKAPTKRKKK